MPSPRPGADAAQLAKLVEQEETLRRLAELAASGADRQELFDAIVLEASRLLGLSLVTLAEIHDQGDATIVALHGSVGGFVTGVRLPAEDDGVFQRVFQTARPARVTYGELSGRWAAAAAARGIMGAVGAPITVDGRLWGALVVSAREEAMPPSLDARVATFAQLLGPAIAGAQARADLLDLLDEQAALRRVAELVARGAGSQELFQVVADEASRLVDGEGTTLMRMSAGGSRGTVLATSGSAAVAVGVTLDIPPDDVGIVASIVRNRASARVDDYREVEGTSYARDDWGIASAAGVPIILEDRVWGLLAASRWDLALPDNVERRLGQFADLVAAALANSAARAEVEALAEEQAALRRVAELVARSGRPEDVFGVVAREASVLLGEATMLVRIDNGDTLVVVASVGGPSDAGWSVPMGPDTLGAKVVRTGRAARNDDYAGAKGPLVAERPGSLSAVAAPISIGGRIWGVLTATSPDHTLAAGTEERLAQFAELIAVAIANAESRAALSASRARVVATADDVRRRIQRDVHDGAQQRLVQTVLTLKLADQALRAGEQGAAGELIVESLEQAQRAATELGDIVRGILPAALTRGGLRAGVDSLVAGLPIEIDARVECDRLDVGLETTAYFVAAESLTNVVKHAHADRATLTILVDGADLLVEIRDDGVGGAEDATGTGLTGLFDRVEAAGGSLTVTSPPGGGTTVRARLPLAAGTPS